MLDKLVLVIFAVVAFKVVQLLVVLVAEVAVTLLKDAVEVLVKVPDMVVFPETARLLAVTFGVDIFILSYNENIIFVK